MRKLVIGALVIIMLMLGVWCFLPAVIPTYCAAYSPFCEPALRACAYDKHTEKNVPPIEQMQKRFPTGYATAIRMCRWPFYSKRSKIASLNALAWYSYCGISKDECLREILRLESMPDYQAHCQWLLSLPGIR